MFEQSGKLDGVFFHSRFTVNGKEPYSEVLGKTMKRKFPDTPIIGKLRLEILFSDFRIRKEIEGWLQRKKLS